MSERQANAPTLRALLPSRLVPEDMLSEWQGPNLPNTKNYAPPSDSLRGRMGDVLMQGIAALGGFTGLPMSDDGDRAALLGELLAAGMPLVGGIKALRGIKAFHGSPHDFDQFSLSKIGTGEGAQAYGHGLYFAENPGVAKSYRDQLSGVSVQPNVSIDAQAAERLGFKSGDGFGTVEQYIRNATRESKGDLAKAASNLRNGAQSQLSGAEHFDAAYQARARQFADQASMAADMIEKGAVSVADNPGRMYEVNIDADPEDFLDWDAPLSQQGEKVRQLAATPVRPVRLEDLSREELISRLQSVDANGVWTDADNIAEFGRPATREELMGAAQSMDLSDYLNQPINQDAPDVTGQSLYRQLTTREGGGGFSNAKGQASASDQLKARGIPGIKYLDGASRMPKFDEALDIREYGSGYMLTGKHASNELFKTKQEAISALEKMYPQSRNYVVFDDTKISIVRKFGIAAALSAGAINELEARQLQAQGYQ